jgi:hypothetical protein
MKRKKTNKANGKIMTEARKKSRYRHIEGKRWIEVRVKSAQQLFDSRDPAPFRERDLDDDFVEYIVSSAREFSYSTPLKIVIYIEDNEAKDLPKASIREAIHSYLTYQIDLQRGNLKTFMKRSQVYLLIGILVLFICLTFSQRVQVPINQGPIDILREGLIIFGWVSMWKPIELILYDWYPLFEKLRFFKKLLATEIDIRFGKDHPMTSS